ncbi:potassium transporter peripheral membrane component [Natrinema pellirubrum DSM 15624]|uniref:K+ transport system, NAD-binding component n=1 Tax=Natrinema pellirubrum (strain DSM 15624 / CIP 106293 / JCM 10476 / NCIMB 786 / 157) TaxID=797303 RepID=L0JJH4_NATP1|nr:Trk system potassium transporter TrkA [Natrinema pellirubrum]AGB31685.1 K+ transport system, NAD-binding component [Natrinema pellirubrum DSM 15624]ELY72895.1 potassium transporter peripheral membrane component [Natrinema pellirubrum DSM 15624]
MHITIIGAGEVGRTIAATLADLHEVVVIDCDEQVAEELTYAHDVLAIHGDGRDIEILREAKINRADLVIACTDDDDVNTVICATVTMITNAFTVARVRHRTLFETWNNHPGAFGVDFMICTDSLTSEAVFRISGLPAAQEVDTFANGLVRMATFETDPESPFVNQTVREIDLDKSVTVAAIFRDDELVLPTGETVIQSTDRIVVIGSASGVTNVANRISVSSRSPTDEVVIAGASEIGLQIARLFEEHGYHPRVIEQDPDRARNAAEALSRTTVLEGDPADIGFLERERIEDADLVITALPDDERNLLVSLVARQLGVSETVAIVENIEYTELFETVGANVTVNPREETAEEIIRFTRLVPTEKIVLLDHDSAEVIEIVVTEESILAGREIRDSTASLPDGVIIGAIARTGELVTPRGTTVIRPEDHVILFVDTDALDEITKVI